MSRTIPSSRHFKPQLIVVERLLLCNDLINTAVERYEACRAGDWTKAQALVEAYVPDIIS